MKKKIFSAYDIIFIISVIAVFIYAVFVSPVHSIADQGDFERVMRPCGLDFPSDYSFYDYAVRFFNMKFTSVDLLLYVPRLLFLVPTTTFIFPTAAARLICLPRLICGFWRLLCFCGMQQYAFLYNANLKLKISFCIVFFCCFLSLYFLTELI